jgi:RNA polymerase sigma factor (sigma-70 family)
MGDDELLQEYLARRSEKAFAELVTRHVNLVYSTAVRIVQDAALAKDVAQNVFILLARKAGTISSGHALPGWLYRVARCQAVNAVRDERVRREREMEAMNMKSGEENPTALWESIRPDLDKAMSTLSAADQNAVVLRFFEGRSWREIGGALALNEDAAQKRVSRALDKLRNYFQRRDLVTSSALVGSAIAANAVQATPAGLALTWAATAYASGAHSFSLLTLIQTLLMKKTTYAVLSAVLTAAITIPILMAKAQPQPRTSVTKANLQQGLALHYTFDREPVAGQIPDASSAGNNGQVVGAQWKSDPQRGGVFQFSPPGQYIRVPNNDSLNSSNLTLAAWIKTSNRGDTWRRIFDKSFTNGFALSIGGGHGIGNTLQGKAVAEFGMAVNNKKGFVRSDKAVTDGEWHHLAVTYNGTEQILYVNGVQQQRVAYWQGGVPANSFDLTIGMNLVDPNPAFNEVNASFDGLIDEPMIYNRALSSDEIKFLFESQRK